MKSSKRSKNKQGFKAKIIGLISVLVLGMAIFITIQKSIDNKLFEHMNSWFDITEQNNSLIPEYTPETPVPNTTQECSWPARDHAL